MKKVLNEKNYIAIADWMLNLNLNTRELLTYAIIYGFCQDGEGYYYASFPYLAEWLGLDSKKSSQNVTRYLKPLVEKNLVVKKEGTSRLNQKLCLYRTVENKGKIINNPEVDYIIIQPWMLKSMHLNGKDLLLYALVHGYSRKESTNVCNYDTKYFSKWLQCRSDHVGRQVEKALQKGLIKEVNKGAFVAIVPDDIKITTACESFDFDLVDPKKLDNTYSSISPQTESTPQNDFPKVRVPLTQTESTSSPKLRGNNLYLENLKDNLELNNDIQKIFKYSDQESLSVVVNRQIIQDNLSLDYEKKAFSYKKEIDFKAYQKHKKTKVDLALLLSKYSLCSFRYLLADWPEADKVSRAQDLLVSAITSNRFKGKEGEIDSLSEENVNDLFHACYGICENDGKEKDVRSPKAYVLGMINNMISEN